MLEKTLESPLDCKEIKPVSPKGISPEYSLERLMLNWNSNTLATWCEEPTHWKRPWFWERLKAGGEGDDRGWDGWMASLTWWTWVWSSSGNLWWTRKPGVLQSMGSQRVSHILATELNWNSHREMAEDFWRKRKGFHFQNLNLITMEHQQKTSSSW